MTTEVMEEAVRVQFTDERPVVSARDLHQALEIGTLFRQWFPRMCEYGFCEGTDYDKVYQKCDGSRTGQMEVDYLISTDMAKHICMIQRTKKGMMYHRQADPVGLCGPQKEAGHRNRCRKAAHIRNAGIPEVREDDSGLGEPASHDRAGTV